MRIILFRFRLVFLFLAMAISFDRCADKCQVRNKYVYLTPVYSTAAEIKAAVAEMPPREINNLGKIYFKDGILYLNETGKGIHIVDDHDPSQPRTIAFLNIPGNLDLAIQGNTLYADSYVDLVAFDISDLQHIKEVSRIEGQFSAYNTYGFYADPQLGILTSWKVEESVTVEKTDCEAQIQSWGGIYYGRGIAFMEGDLVPIAAATNSPSVATGIGGSMARFTIMNKYLYGLDGSNLDVVDISVAGHPVAGASIPVNWDAQTLFPHNDHLFVGARAGMYIFDLSAPDQPALISQYDHILSCDPVVVEGNYAYVTLYSGDVCHVDTNELEVIDISDLTAPSSVKTYPMTNPHGLGISNGTLFICDGADGLKIYDASDPMTISDHLLAHYDQIHALDVIPINNLAMVIGSDGLYQYDYSNPRSISLLSNIAIVKE